MDTIKAEFTLVLLHIKTFTNKQMEKERRKE